MVGTSICASASTRHTGPRCLVEVFCAFFELIFACAGSWLLHRGFLQLLWAGAALCECAGFSLRWLVAEHKLQVCGLQQLQHSGSVLVVHGLSCSAACGIFPDQGLNPRPLHWQADSNPLCHLGRLVYIFIIGFSSENLMGAGKRQSVEDMCLPCPS